MTPYIVPNADFYRIDTALVVPQIDAARLVAAGARPMVDQEVTIDWATLLAKPLRAALVTLTCVSNEVGGDLVGNAVWTGWPVRELLGQAGPQRRRRHGAVDAAVDGLTAGTPLDGAHRRPRRAARRRR